MCPSPPFVGSKWFAPYPAPGDHGGVLQARALSVEVGGRLTLVEASFNVRAGDKVGLVGRNGAGKTSLLRVLAGEAPSFSGAIVRQGALGYPSQLCCEGKPRSRPVGSRSGGGN